MIGFLASIALLVAPSRADELQTVLNRANSPKPNDDQVIDRYGVKAFPEIYRRLDKPVGKSNDYEMSNRPRLAYYLCRVATAAQAGQVVHLFDLASRHEATKIYETRTYIHWLANKADPVQNRGFFEAHLADYPTDSCYALARIADAKAIQSIANTLRTTKRREETIPVFVELNSIQKPEAIAEIDRLSTGARTIAPLPDRSRRDASNKDGFAVKSTFTRPNGEKIGLATWDGLGSPQDLWLVRWNGTAWVDPTFTGLSMNWPRTYPGGPMAGAEEHAKTIENLIASKSWVKKFADNPELAKDSDHDGLTDVVEKWIGTDPHKADTDGDGILDGIDKNPLAKPAAGDGLALQAALVPFTISAYGPQHNLIVRLDKGVAPFELESFPGSVYMYPWDTESKLHSRDLFGYWLTMVRTRARGPNSREVEISESYGYYTMMHTVTVVRVGSRWRVQTIATRMGAIS